MVHSKGTRCESQRLRIDFTGRTKYSGRPSAFRGSQRAGKKLRGGRCQPAALSRLATFRQQRSPAVFQPRLNPAGAIRRGGFRTLTTGPWKSGAALRPLSLGYAHQGYRERVVLGLVVRAATDRKARHRIGENWRHSPPRSSKLEYFAFYSPCQVKIFAFYSLQAGRIASNTFAISRYAPPSCAGPDCSLRQPLYFCNGTPVPVPPRQVGLLVLEEHAESGAALRQILDSEGLRVRIVPDVPSLFAELRTAEYSW